MTFEALETSTSDGRPLELYQFEVIGTIFRFTNGERTIVKDGQDFLSVPVTREDIEQSNKSITGQFQLSWGLGNADSDTFLDLWISGAPEDNTDVTIFKEHVDDPSTEFITFWSGEIRDVSFVDSITCEMLLSNVGSFFSDKGPRMTWGGHCNHNFGDELCTFAVSSVTRTLTVTAIATNGITVTIGDLSTGQTAGDYVRGELRVGGFSRRYIAEDNLPSNQITLMYPLPDLDVGDSVQVVEGCPHNVTACNDRFTNIEFYGGTPYTPNINQFERTLDKI